MLGFETERTVLFVIHSAHAGEFPVQKIPGVKLNAGFGGEYFHAASVGRF